MRLNAEISGSGIENSARWQRLQSVITGDEGFRHAEQCVVKYVNRGNSHEDLNHNWLHFHMVRFDGRKTTGVSYTLRQFLEIPWEKLVAQLSSLPDHPAAENRCYFCGKTYDQVRKTIMGPSVCICSECVEAVSAGLSSDLPSPWLIDEKNRCSFCGRDESYKLRVFMRAESESRICEECIRLCVEVIK